MLSKLTWDEILEDNAQNQRSVINLLSSSMVATLNAQANLLDLVGDSLLDDQNYMDEEKSIRLLSKLLNNNPAIIAFGLAQPDGHLIFTSDNLNRNNLPNLAHYPASADSFAETLLQNNMVLGRTYLMPTLQEWVMPIRKALRDENNQVVAVMTAGLRVSGRDAFLEGNGLEDSSNAIFIVREVDKYPQYVSPTVLANDSEIYNSAIPDLTYDHVIDTLAQQDMPKTDLYLGKISHSVAYTNRYGDKQILTLKFIPQYNLWGVTTTSQSLLVTRFLHSFWLFLGCFLTVIAVIFYLFKRIIHSEQQHIQQLQYKTQHQELTKLPNMYGLKAVLTENELCYGPNHIAVIYIDIDNFKSANESYGTDFGDQILIDVASRLKMHKAEKDLIFHLNGDEYLMKKAFSDPSRIEEFVSNLHRFLSQPYSRNSAEIILTMSIGVAFSPEHGKSFENIIQAAEIAMFEAKKQKNHFVFFGDDIYQTYQENLQIEQQLKHSIGSDEFFMNYQPQVINDGEIIGIEALARWDNATLGLVRPDKFIKIAESSGLMPRLGMHILTMIFTDLKDIDRQIDRPFSVSINISASQFLQHDFYPVFEALHKTAALQQIKICLELTESLFIEDTEYILPVIEKLHALGISISLDDFGTGFSSLSMLRKLPIDELKIDKSFIDSLIDDETSRKMIQNIISIGEILDMSVIAEGVETLEQTQVLKSINCHRFQGYYFSKPLVWDQLKEKLMSQ
ncbi:bifunctional diguanylate cyclase/phosphodiesterase [Methylophaga sp.]|uniref:bifunctional diguanylate cyclase/phosphodiesterase n=1 Tax=Methylophaga sp. TaxID=2024840 RepID=UPI003F6A1AD2